MEGLQTRMMYELNKYCCERVEGRRAQICRSVRDVIRVVQELLREVELHEPRFVSSLTDTGGRYEGLRVISPNQFEVILYLNQMGVFNFVDDGAVPGCAVLKLSDGRKRSMSLWVEFITASGYLSARKIRSRFQSLMSQAVDKYTGKTGPGSVGLKLISETSEVKLKIKDRYTVHIIPAFHCSGIWPRSAAHWPHMHLQWPPANLVAEIKSEGFDLLSKESSYCRSVDKQTTTEGDAWVISFHQAEASLMYGGCRKKCYSVLKTLSDQHLDLPGQPVEVSHLKALLLYECEKHPRDVDWEEGCLGDRINGILLQLISCLQNRRCPHYFLPALDLFRGKTTSSLDNAAKQAWRVLRELITNPRCLEKL